MQLLNHCDSIINEGIARNKKRREGGGDNTKGKGGKEKNVKIRWKKTPKKGTEMECTRARGFNNVIA